MAIDSTIPIRRAIMTLQKGDANLTAIVPGARIFPQSTSPNPEYPFTRMGAITSIPIRSSCVDGGSFIFAVHGFAQPRVQAGQVVETAEDHAGRIGAAIAAAIDGQQITLPNGRARVRWTGGQLLQDPEEASVYHTVQNFEVRALTA